MGGVELLFSEDLMREGKVLRWFFFVSSYFFRPDATGDPFFTLPHPHPPPRVNFTNDFAHKKSHLSIELTIVLNFYYTIDAVTFMQMVWLLCFGLFSIKPC